jgi:hypothetical protein
MNGQRQKQDDEAICVHPETGMVTEGGSERSGLSLMGVLVTRDRRRVVGSDRLGSGIARWETKSEPLEGGERGDL